MIDKAGILKVP